MVCVMKHRFPFSVSAVLPKLVLSIVIQTSKSGESKAKRRAELKPNMS